MTDASSVQNPLVALSNELADAIAQAGQSVVAVNARQRRSSTGVHWQSGVIVTTHQTVRRDDDITITLPDGRTVPATLAGRDPGTDLAVLTVADLDLPTVTLNDAAQLKVGHIVLAIARSSESISASWGVISTLSGTWRTWHGGQIDQFIRPDINLYPGFSGGPLITSEGRIVGINTSGPRHMALTIPALTVNRVVNQLLNTGRVARGYLGIGMQPVQLPETLISSLNLLNKSGLILVSVEPGSPADQAGVLIGDILITLDDTPTTDVGDVHALLDPERVGRAVSARLIRGGVPVERTITIGERPRRADA